MKNKFLDKQYVSMKAKLIYNLAVERAGKNCPDWVKNDPAHVSKIMQIYKSAVINNLKLEFGEDRWEVDHVVPLNGVEASGLHVWWNLVLLPKSVNSFKSNQVVESWSKESDFVYDSVYGKQKYKTQKEKIILDNTARTVAVKIKPTLLKSGTAEHTHGKELNLKRKKRYR